MYCPFHCTQIIKKKVDSYESGRRIPSCQLRLKWTKSQPPVDIQHRVNLHGARDPPNYITILSDPLPQGKQVLIVIHAVTHDVSCDDTFLRVLGNEGRFPQPGEIQQCGEGVPIAAYCETQIFKPGGGGGGGGGGGKSSPSLSSSPNETLGSY